MKFLVSIFLIYSFSSNALIPDFPNFEEIEILDPTYICYGSKREAKDLIFLVDRVNAQVAQGSRNSYKSGDRSGLKIILKKYLLDEVDLSFSLEGWMIGLKIVMDIVGGIGTAAYSDSFDSERIKIKCVQTNQFRPESDYY